MIYFTEIIEECVKTDLYRNSRMAVNSYHGRNKQKFQRQLLNKSIATLTVISTWLECD